MWLTPQSHGEPADTAPVCPVHPVEMAFSEGLFQFRALFIVKLLWGKRKKNIKVKRRKNFEAFGVKWWSAYTLDMLPLARVGFAFRVLSPCLHADLEGTSRPTSLFVLGMRRG